MSWADVEDSGSDGNNSSAGCGFRAPHANVEAQVASKASEAGASIDVARVSGGARKRKGKRSKATKGTSFSSRLTLRVMSAMRAEWLEERGGLECDY